MRVVDFHCQEAFEVGLMQQLSQCLVIDQALANRNPGEEEPIGRRAFLSGIRSLTWVARQTEQAFPSPGWIVQQAQEIARVKVQPKVF